MAYSKQTWDTTSYVNPTRMNHMEEGIYDNSIEIDTIKNNGGVLYPANTTIKCVGQITNYNNGASLLGLFVPLENADKYNITFTSQKEMGTDRQTYFTNTQFNLQIAKNGFWFFTANADVLYWFFALGRTDTQYEFVFTISPIS